MSARMGMSPVAIGSTDGVLAVVSAGAAAAGALPGSPGIAPVADAQQNNRTQASDPRRNEERPGPAIICIGCTMG